MCFNPLMTWTTAGLGFGVAIFAKTKINQASLYFPPAYFAFMEILQGIMYWQLQHPSWLFLNIIIYIAYLHVCFQPLVFNFWLGSFISPDKKANYLFTLKLCLIGGLLLLSRVFVSEITPLCLNYETLCSTKPEVFNGLYHIAWSLPLIAGGWHYITPSIALHFFLFFIPGLFLGLYWLMIAFFLLGPYLAAHITSNVSEQSSIWCVMGLWLMIITLFLTLKYKKK